MASHIIYFVLLSLSLSLRVTFVVAKEKDQSIEKEKNQENFYCPTAIFNFGDSLSDTGNAAIAFPRTGGALTPPYGRSYFQRPAGRFSDGRNLLDFIAQAFSFPLIAPYLQDFYPDFRRGVNFAYGGATADNDTMLSPFSLTTQTQQFLSFKERTLDALLQPACRYCGKSLPREAIYRQGLYVVSIGGNDLIAAYYRGLNASEVMDTIVPTSVASIILSILDLYNSGAKKFMVLSVPAEGCSPLFLTDFGGSGAAVDELGCLKDYNNVVMNLNRRLYTEVLGLRTNLFDSIIIYVDYYSANRDVLENPTTYGMLEGETLKACCGAGGEYNFDSRMYCGNSGMVDGRPTSAAPCDNPEQYISWDGIHFTQAFYKQVAEKILTGNFVHPPINLALKCGLNFSKFNDTSFQSSYPEVPLI